MEKEEVKKTKEAETEKPKEETPKGFYLAKVPTDYGIVMMKGEKQVSTEALIVKMANALETAGLMKE